MLGLNPGGHVHADDFAQHLGPLGVGLVDARPKLPQRLFGNRHAAADVHDLLILTENERTAREADACRVGTPANHIRPRLEGLVQAASSTPKHNL